MNWMSRLFSQDGTKPAKKLGLASFTFESRIGGVIGSERAKAALAEFDRTFPNRLIYDKTEVREAAETTHIVLVYLTSDAENISLWQKFSEIARRTGL